MAEADKVRRLAPAGQEIGADAWISHIYARTGRRAEARTLLQTWLQASAQRHVEPYNIAAWYASLGERDRAFECLQKSYDQHSPSMVYLKIDPLLDEGFRQDPRYTELLRRMRFPE